MRIFASLAGLLCASTLFAQPAQPLYQNDFSKADVGKVPDDFLVLDGGFAVREDGTNKFLELPGAPLDSFGVLFGPTEKGNLSASARIFATHKGRRYPTFGLGLNGVGGYRLQVSPGKKQVELYRGETLKTSAPFEWQPDRWTHLRLQIRQSGSGYEVEGKVWTEGAPEPAAATITTTDKEEIPAGRAGVFGSPFSGTPIRFDDLVVARP